jgi:L-alanine-DL-glutamate epimerase-like enolase superfamily enzyme
VAGGPLFEDGYAPVPDGPGLGIDLDPETVREHTRDGDPVLV